VVGRTTQGTCICPEAIRILLKSKSTALGSITGPVRSQAIAYWERSKAEPFNDVAYLREMDDSDFYPIVGVRAPLLPHGELEGAGRQQHLTNRLALRADHLCWEGIGVLLLLNMQSCF
jgi:hypothetical protein